MKRDHHGTTRHRKGNLSKLLVLAVLLSGYGLADVSGGASPPPPALTPTAAPVQPPPPR